MSSPFVVPSRTLTLLLIQPLSARDSRLPRPPALHNPPLLLGRKHGRPLLQRVDQDVERVVLEVVGRADLVEVLGELLGGALEVVRGEFRGDGGVGFCVLLGGHFVVRWGVCCFGEVGEVDELDVDVWGEMYPEDWAEV